ncbi:MAG: PQQ-binding-like beta-propeller repeat protein [Hyphomonadaceae bacterium]|nr:PQQ-binding-like beta-propeller repeat protein [Hyphomonadaceae bacterium]
MSRLVSAAVLAAAAALSGCSTVQRVGDAVWPFSGGGDSETSETAPQDGRVSILTFEQQLAPDPELASRTITTPAPAAIANWSQPGGEADNAPPNATGSATLERAFRANLGAGSDSHVRLAAPPVIADGKLYFLDAETRVHAVDASDGRSLWSERLRPQDSEDRHASGGGIAVAGGRVFVTTGFGFAAALDAADGREVWRFNGRTPFVTAPTAAGGRVYATTSDSELVALDATTGELQWNFQSIAETARILSASSVAASDDTIIAPFASGEIVALLSANGRRLWTDSLSRSGRLTSLSAINDIAGRPVVDGGVAYAASHSGVLAAIDVRSGQRVWARAFASTQTPFAAGDVLYAVSVDGELAAFDRATGTVYWVRQLRRYEDEDDREGRVSWTGPIMVNGKLILASSLGEVVAVSAETGVIETTVDVDQSVFIPPVTANGLIYFVTDDARLIALR